ncbi:MAG: hypothetical protein J5502_07235 [Prevotella sp.]|nr:hypothetical protein [Prevotella sp.]
MNEETIIENRPVISGQNESQADSNSWKYVTLGGVSGILMGAGLMYAGNANAATRQNEELSNQTSTGTPNSEQQDQNTPEASLPVAKLHNELSFGEAFAQARAEVGPGGLFIWHGGIYNTYTVEEWNAMTPQQKIDFAHQVNPEYRAHDFPTPTDVHPEVVVHVVVDGTPEQSSNSIDVSIVEKQIAHNFDMGEDVYIVGYANAAGHLVVGYDTTGDGQADVAIIDVDNNFRPSDDDVIMDNQGNKATLGELNNEQDANHLASEENPDVAPDMPDYMNDAMIIDA